MLLACGLAPCGTLRYGRLGVPLEPSICGSESFLVRQTTLSTFDQASPASITHHFLDFPSISSCMSVLAVSTCIAHMLRFQLCMLAISPERLVQV